MYMFVRGYTMSGHVYVCQEYKMSSHVYACQGYTMSGHVYVCQGVYNERSCMFVRGIQ